ncbi:MAG: hypothetical protein GC159_03925 [Phycisphaera sp.]|nr:hypothetical protein [Phycisphaera sp.]
MTSTNYSEGDLDAAARYVRDLERQAMSWPRTRLILLVVTVFTAVQAARYGYACYEGMTTRYDVIGRMKEADPTLEKMPPELWHVAELRRAVALLQASNDKNLVVLIDAIIAIFLGAGSAFCASMLIRRWRDEPKLAIIAKLARHQYEQICHSQESEDASDAS